MNWEHLTDDQRKRRRHNQAVEKSKLMRTIDTQEKRIEAFETLSERWEATKLPRVAPVPKSKSSTEQDEQEQMRNKAVGSISDEFE